MQYLEQWQNTSLCIAAVYGYPKLCSLLLQAGCFIEVKQQNNKTPLMLAVQNNHLRVAETLLEWGARLDQELQNGQTVIDLAKSKQMLQLLNKYVPGQQQAVSYVVEQSQSQYIPKFTSSRVARKHNVSYENLASSRQTMNRSFQQERSLHIMRKSAQRVQNQLNSSFSKTKIGALSSWHRQYLPKFSHQQQLSPYALQTINTNYPYQKILPHRRQASWQEVTRMRPQRIAYEPYISRDISFQRNMKDPLGVGFRSRWDYSHGQFMKQIKGRYETRQTGCCLHKHCPSHGL